MSRIIGQWRASCHSPLGNDDVVGGRRRDCQYGAARRRGGRQSHDQQDRYSVHTPCNQGGYKGHCQGIHQKGNTANKSKTDRKKECVYSPRCEAGNGKGNQASIGIIIESWLIMLRDQRLNPEFFVFQVLDSGFLVEHTPARVDCTSNTIVLHIADKSAR